MGDGGGSQSTGWSQGYSRPLAERAHPSQWALYGPNAAMLMQRAYGGERDKQITASNLRNQAMSDAAGATQRMGNTMSGQGVSAQSPLYASLNRGIQTDLMSKLSGAESAAEKAQRATQAGYAGMLTGALSNWPPAESWSTSSQMSSGGGGGK